MATPEKYDVIIIGAGFSGLYALHRLRDYKVVCFESGDGVGGTWYWNRYPGARVDIESMEYSYGFDDDLQQEWHWPEYFSAQADLERYANHVADRFDLRKHIRFSHRVTKLVFDEGDNSWQLESDQGDRVVAKYVIAATGALTVPNIPPWPGREDYQGPIYHTARWPEQGVDFSGQRVGFIGTGSTGIQAMPIIAEQASELLVFQRTPAFCMPSGNRPLDAEHERDWKAHYTERRKQMLGEYGASLVDYPELSIDQCTPEQRQEILENAWNSQSAFQLLFAFDDVLTNKAVNDVVSEFVRNKIRSIVKDRATAELLCPTTYPIGGRRLCIGNGYYEMFNRDNVTLVDVSNSPITAFTRDGLKTASGEYPLDAIVAATGFDAVTGAMMNIDIHGLGGKTLAEHWAQGPKTYLGAMTAGFPNLFMIHGPMTPGAQAQMITTGEWQVNWTADIISDLEQKSVGRIDATGEGEAQWAREVAEVSSYTLHQYADSWYNGKNIEGKPGGFMVYVGGFPRFAELCEQAVARDYEGFSLS